MKQYREFQFGWWIFIVLIPIQIFSNYFFFNEPSTETFINNNHPLILNGVILLIYFLFYGMTVVVKDEKICIVFGFGLIRKMVKTTKIDSIDIVTNPWYYGWGIRLIPNGWLYNISGSQGIELKFSDRKSIIRIGTSDPVQLKNEITKRLTKHL